MKDDTSTPTGSGQDTSPNEFERGKPTTVRRDQAEAAIERLRKEGGVFVNAVRATRMAMAITDPTLPGNPIVFANESFLKMSGYRMDEVLGQQPHFMNGPDTDPKDVARFLEALQTDQDDLVETVQYRKNGSRFIATVLLSAFKDDSGHTLNHFMSWLDVTRRAQAENEVSELRETQAALQASEAKYRGLFNSIDEGFALIEVILDDEGRPVDLLHLETNPAYERHAGVSNVAGKRALEIAPDFDSMWFDFYGKVARTGEAARIETYLEAPVDRWINLHASRVGGEGSRKVAVVFNDVSERKNAEIALRNSEDRQAFLLKFTDAIRSEPTQQKVVERATQMLAQELSLDRCYATRLFPDEDSTEVIHEVRGSDLAPIPPLLRNSDFPEAFRQTFQGTLVFEDTANDPALSDADKAALASMNFGALLSRPLRRDGSPIFAIGAVSSQPRRWTQSEKALVEEVAERTWEAAERAKNAEALRESDKLRTAMLDVLPLGLALTDREGKVIFSNREWARFIPGEVIPSRDPDSLSRWRSWHADGRPVAPTDFPGARALRGERVDPPMEFLFDDGEREIWTSVAAIPVRGKDAQVEGAVDVIQDIDTAKRATEALQDSERHAQVLLAELQHRVRNTLAVVRSIARRTAESTPESTDFMSHFEGRLNAFSRVQAVVTRSADGSVELKSLVEDELLTLAAQQGEHLRIDGPQVCLTPRAAESMSLAVHELATNAVKYGALSARKGKIDIIWQCVREDGGQVLNFDWREHGLESVPTPTREGFGHELLLRSLPYDLGAKTKIVFEDDGLHFTMILPLTAENVAAERSTPAE